MYAGVNYCMKRPASVAGWLALFFLPVLCSIFSVSFIRDASIILLVQHRDFSLIRCHRASKASHEAGRASKPTVSIGYPITLLQCVDICARGGGRAGPG